MAPALGLAGAGVLEADADLAAGAVGVEEHAGAGEDEALARGEEAGLHGGLVGVGDAEGEAEEGPEGEGVVADGAVGYDAGAGDYTD